MVNHGFPKTTASLTTAIQLLAFILHLCNIEHSKDPIAQLYRQEMITSPRLSKDGEALSMLQKGVMGRPKKKGCWLL